MAAEQDGEDVVGKEVAAVLHQDDGDRHSVRRSYSDRALVVEGAFQGRLAEDHSHADLGLCGMVPSSFSRLTWTMSDTASSEVRR